MPPVCILSSFCSPKPPSSDAVASAALILVWIAVLGHIPLLIIGTKWGIDTEVAHIHNINNHISTQTHMAAFVYTQWTRGLESIQLRGRIFHSIYNACSRQPGTEHFEQQIRKRLNCLQLLLCWFFYTFVFVANLYSLMSATLLISIKSLFSGKAQINAARTNCTNQKTLNAGRFSVYFYN